MDYSCPVTGLFLSNEKYNRTGDRPASAGAKGGFKGPVA